MASSAIFGMCEECGNSGLAGDVCSQCGGKMVREGEGADKFEEDDELDAVKPPRVVEEDDFLFEDEEPDEEDLADLEVEDGVDDGTVSLEDMEDEEVKEENAPGKSTTENEEE